MCRADGLAWLTGTLTFASRVRATELGGASKGTQSAKKAALNAVLGMSRMKASSNSGSSGGSGGSGDATSSSPAEESLWLSPSGGAPKSPQPRSRSVDSPPVRAAAQLSPAKTPEAEAEAEASEEPQRRSPKAPGSPPARKQNLDHLLNAGAPSSPAPTASKSGSFTVFVDDEAAAGKGKARAPGGGLYAKVTALEAAERDKENEKVKLPFIGSDDFLLPYRSLSLRVVSSQAGAKLGKGRLGRLGPSAAAGGGTARGLRKGPQGKGNAWLQSLEKLAEDPVALVGVQTARV